MQLFKVVFFEFILFAGGFVAFPDDNNNNNRNNSVRWCGKMRAAKEKESARVRTKGSREEEDEGKDANLFSYLSFREVEGCGQLLPLRPNYVLVLLKCLF